jgi:pimeloyl-ACP methyl ester carboxylesterase
MMSRAPLLPSQLFPRTEDTWFYVHYFSEPGLAEHDLQANVELSLRQIYFAASGEAGPRDDPATPNPFGLAPRKQPFLDTLPIPTELPSWLAPEDMDAFVKAFSRTGFTGGLNYYRNLDRNWRCEAAFVGLRVEVPALYMVGERDTGLAIPGMQDIIQAMSALAPQLRGSHVIPKAGHWLPQEAPDAVNSALLGFLRTL